MISIQESVFKGKQGKVINVPSNFVQLKLSVY